jgi:hypothetical protein
MYRIANATADTECTDRTNTIGTCDNIHAQGTFPHLNQHYGVDSECNDVDRFGVVGLIEQSFIGNSSRIDRTMDQSFFLSGFWEPAPRILGQSTVGIASLVRTDGATTTTTIIVIVVSLSTLF